MSESNRAAWIKTRMGKPLEVDDAPMPAPQAHEIVIRNRAIAINPIDWKMQDLEEEADFGKYPWILGIDGAGEIVAVGADVQRFQVGDRVLATFDAQVTQRTTNSGFQLYAATSQHMAAVLPDNVGFREAAVLPLAVSTAAAGLYQKHALALPYPTSRHHLSSENDDSGNKKTLLVWGGASSVGSATIQLARASGLRVVTTASARNRDFCTSLGAARVFDYGAAGVEEEIVAALRDEGAELVGVYDAISSQETAQACVRILERAGGDDVRGKKVLVVIPFLKVENVPESIETPSILATKISTDEVGPAIWGNWVSGALASGQLQCKPDPLVVGQGLEKLQEAVQRNKEGVSARKVVVELP